MRSQVSNRISQLSYLRSQFSNLRSQFSNLKLQFSNLRSQFSNLRSHFTNLTSQFTKLRYQFSKKVFFYFISCSLRGSYCVKMYHTQFCRLRHLHRLWGIINLLTTNVYWQTKRPRKGTVVQLDSTNVLSVTLDKCTFWDILVKNNTI